MMNVSYNKMFKLLIDEGMKHKATGSSPNTLTKLSNNEYLSMEVICDLREVGQ